MTKSAVIFDMDGLLVDSEPLWAEAEFEVLGRVGISMTQEMSSETSGMRVDELVDYWYQQYPWTQASSAETADALIDRVCELVVAKGKLLPGVLELIQLCQERDFLLGVATSSPLRLAKTTLRHFQLESLFDTVTSAEDQPSGKPHPAIYLASAESLGVHPANCLAFEDSVRGMQSALAAGITCVVVPASDNRDHPEFKRAALQLTSLEEVSDAMLHDLLNQKYEG